MKILQIITLSELGGAQSVVINLANSLCEEHEVIVVAGTYDGKMWSMLDKRIIRESCGHLRRSLSPLHDFMVLIFLFKLYFKYKPDIIQLHSSKAGILGRIIFPSKKIIYTVHGFDSIRLRYRKYLPVERFMQRWCKAIVGVSEYDKRNLLTEYISNNVTCVYNGIKRPASLQEDPFLFLREYKRKVLCIARISPQKNNKLFLQVAALLPDYAFIWIGNQDDITEAIPSNVFFLGNIPNAGAYNEYIDLFMLPTNYEGLPMVIIEAMSFGKPVVASDVGGISEIVINNENGYTVENVPEVFVDKIKNILENEQIYKIFSENAICLFNSKLTIDHMVEGYMDIYQS